MQVTLMHPEVSLYGSPLSVTFKLTQWHHESSTLLWKLEAGGSLLLQPFPKKQQTEGLTL